MVQMLFAKMSSEFWFHRRRLVFFERFFALDAPIWARRAAPIVFCFLFGPSSLELEYGTPFIRLPPEDEDEDEDEDDDEDEDKSELWELSDELVLCLFRLGGARLSSLGRLLGINVLSMYSPELFEVSDLNSLF